MSSTSETNCYEAFTHVFTRQRMISGIACFVQLRWLRASVFEHHAGPNKTKYSSSDSQRQVQGEAWGCASATTCASCTSFLQCATPRCECASVICRLIQSIKEVTKCVYLRWFWTTLICSVHWQLRRAIFSMWWHVVVTWICLLHLRLQLCSCTLVGWECCLSPHTSNSSSAFERCSVLRDVLRVWMMYPINCDCQCFFEKLHGAYGILHGATYDE